jgi:osmotically-inducible protein OsmY
MNVLRNRGAMLMGLGIGAGLMYLLDPERGRRRRVLVRDKVVRATNVAADAMGATGRDVAHRATGAAARLRRALSPAPVDDTILAERVRAQLGRWVSHPRAIEVESRDGVVTLRGPVLQREVPRLLSAVERVRGVRDVVSAVEEHTEAGSIPALQGGRSV